MIDACWDCGSTIKGHHTPKCELAEGVKDLPQIEGTQYWAESAAGIAYDSGADCRFHPLTGRIVNQATGLPGAGAFLGDA